MPPKNAKKTQEDAAEVDVEVVETLSSFERQMLEKWEKMNGTMSEISKNVSKLTKHFITSKENTIAKEVVSDTSDTSAKILQEMAGTLKEILKSKDTSPMIQPGDVHQSTQILIEQEIEKAKQSMIQTWNQKLQKRAAEFWQMIRNENTAKSYETWKNSAPIIIPRKLQMKQINGEPLSQTQLREKQVLLNFQTELELMKLRAESHQERYQKIDNEMEEIIDKKWSGQRKELLKKQWKEDCLREEQRSQERWQNSNLKWTDKYETDFKKFYETKNPFLWDDGFMPPKLRSRNQQKEQPSENIGLYNSDQTKDADVVITGVSSYAQAAQKHPAASNNMSKTPGTTYIGKKVRFNNQNATTTQQKTNTRPPLLSNPPFPSNATSLPQNQNTRPPLLHYQPAPNRTTMQTQNNLRYPPCPPYQPPPNNFQNRGYNEHQNTDTFLYRDRTPYTTR